MSTETKITLRDNGPLVVANPPTLRDSDGNEIETKPVTALCRCGKSAGKPFCDGAHKSAGFESSPDPRGIRNDPLTYEGEVGGTPVKVHYTPVLCSHAGACAEAASTVFRPGEKPWIQPSEGDMAGLLRAMAACPSGALRIETGETGPQHLTAAEVEISIEKNGPYRVRNVPLDCTFNGIGASRAKYVLCRCGQSKNKPFCDGTHHDIGWRDDA
ncbi:MAG: CDGSH iron-sulfur domain-containing protein [Pseudomonadota bacterium]